MADPPPDPDADADREVATPAPRAPSSGRPGWQKVVGVVAAALLLGLALVLGTGDHGPDRHAPGSEFEQGPASDGPEGHDPSRWDH